MNSDQLAYEVFVVDPGSYFEMAGEPRSEADHYDFHAVDFKAVERRLDGYFEPRDAERPLHFLEVMFYKKENAYANLFAKVFLKLEQDPARDWRSVILFESASLRPKVEKPYEDLLAGKRVKLIYLDTLPEGPKSGFGLAILKLAAKPRPNIPHDANLLVKRVKQEITNDEKRAKILELIEFVAISKLAHLSDEEVRAMLDLEDYRKSRFYQGGVQEGKAENRAEVVHRMAAKGYDVNEIADIVGVDVNTVKEILKKKPT